MATDALAAPLHFDAILHPHRSLSARGFFILMMLLCAVSFAGGIAFALLGAWPVFGFFGLDVLAVYVAFRINYRSGRLLETLQLSNDELLLRRILPDGSVQSWSFPSYWVQVLIENGRGCDGALKLRSHGREVACAAFLTDGERLDLAAALKQALARCRGAMADQPLNPSTSAIE